MTMSKGGSQETPGKTRSSSNALNPDAPEFNPRTKSTGKLNANAPEFVPGQLHNFESVMINMPEMKGYKNGHMPAYTISHQEQCVPVWVPQTYPVNVPIPHFYNNAPIDLISCDFTQTQNYPIQRNVYPTQPHNDYHLNPPYNVVAQGKSKLNNKSNKSKTPVKETGVSARDNISVATTKDTTRDTTVTPTKEVAPEPNKPLTWAERTKLSTRQPQKPTVTPSLHTHVAQTSTTVKEVPKDTVKEHRHPTKEVGKEHKDPVKDTGAHRERSKDRDRSERDRDRDRADKSDKEYKNKTELDLSRDSDEHDRRDKSRDKETTVKQHGREHHEQASYANVFKEAVKSSTVISSAATTAVPKESRSEQPTETIKEVVRSTPSTLATSKEVTSTVSNEVSTKRSSSTSVTSSTDAEATNVTDSTKDSVLEDSVDKDTSNEYSVNTMLSFYVYLFQNKKMVDDIREKYQLPKLNFSTTTSSGTPNKSNYKDRDRDRDRSERDRDRDRADKSDKKDWRHKSYDKNFGNNFRFNNKEFSRASNEFTPSVVASESSWVIKQAKQKSDKEALLRRKIMGLLNRLTFEKFDIIYKQIIECGIDTPEHAEMLVRFVFEKAVTQHHFIPMYVELCAKLAIDLYTIDNGGSTNGAPASVTKAASNQTDRSHDQKNRESRPEQPTETIKEVDRVDVTDSNTSVNQDSVDKNVYELDKNAVDKRSDESDVSVKDNKDEEDLDRADKQPTSSDQSTLVKGSEHVAATSSLEGVSLNPDELVDPKTNRKSDFMRILLNCSQDSFEDNLKPLEIPVELEGDDRFEFEQKYKHKMRGNMIFVGELFKQKLLAAKLLITCLDQVFLKREECILLYDDVNMGNNHLEAMCTLLQTVGRSFDTNRWKHLSEFEKRIQHLEDLGKNELISFRIRCLIKNVLDSRMEHWDKSIYQKQDQPCKLQELRHKHSSSSFNLLSTSNNSSSNLNTNNNRDKDRERDRELSKKESRDDRDEVWRMRNRKNKSSNNLVAFGKTEKNRKELTRNMSKDSFSESMESKKLEMNRERSKDKDRLERDLDRDRGDKSRLDSVDKKSDKDNLEKTQKRRYRKKLVDEEDSELDKLEDLEEEDEDISDEHEGVNRDNENLDYTDELDELEDVDEEDYDDSESYYKEPLDVDRYKDKEDEENDNEKLYKNVRSIVNELVLSHDVEESSIRVEELNLEENKFNEFYRLLIITCMENCSKVNTDKESKLVTKWIVDTAKEKNKINNLIEGLYEFVFGEDKYSMNMLMEDFPLLPNTLKLLINNMNSECENNQKFKEILTQI